MHRLPLFLLPSILLAQAGPDQAQILQRLERLEQQNRMLMEEVKELRQQIAATRPPPAPSLEERVEVQEKRTEEQSQTKVEASQRFPLSITGMALFNAFITGRNNNGLENPTVAALSPGPSTSGATFRQTMIGLKYEGPQALGATVRGTVLMDFFQGSSASLNHLLRLRVANISLDWKNQTLTVGQDKPLISLREPNSLSQVGVSSFTSAGNLWLWQPQVRFEQRAALGTNAGLRAQVSVYQTSETSTDVPAQFASSLERSRPALQGRFEVWRQFENGGRIEIAPGFHTSTTHVAATSVPSRLFTLDWSLQPLLKWKLVGMFFTGENPDNMGSLRQGFTILGQRNVIPVHGSGGWAQLSYSPTNRLTFSVINGQHDGRNVDLRSGSIGKNLESAANLQYRLAPNVFLGFEASQVRTTYLGIGKRLNNHYDLALAYLF
ncbi:MAG: hypothetical protein ABJF23_00435 [Bryobacteraceae bacterium]